MCSNILLELTDCQSWKKWFYRATLLQLKILDFHNSSSILPWLFLNIPIDPLAENMLSKLINGKRIKVYINAMLQLKIHLYSCLLQLKILWLFIKFPEHRFWLFQNIPIAPRAENVFLEIKRLTERQTDKTSAFLEL